MLKTPISLLLQDANSYSFFTIGDLASWRLTVIVKKQAGMDQYKSYFGHVALINVRLGKYAGKALSRRSTTRPGFVEIAQELVRRPVIEDVKSEIDCGASPIRRTPGEPGFWKWLIDGIRSKHPDAFLLAEAFTRPIVLWRLAKAGKETT